MGIGNELNADDGAGVLAARELQARLGQQENLLVLEAGPAPEAFTGPLRRFKPDLVLLMDAGHFGGQVGELALFDSQEAAGFSASTHTLPPSLLAGFLSGELGCEVMILAIQAGQLDFDIPASAEVLSAVELFVMEFSKQFGAG